MSHPSARPVARLLPWTGSADQPCYLLTDQKGDGPVSRYADRVEALQLAMSVGLLDHADPLIDDPSADAGQLRFLSAQLRTALRDTVRVAESRGERLAAYQWSQEPDEPDESDPEGRAPEGDEAEGDQRARKGHESGESEEPNKSSLTRTSKAGQSGENGGGGGGDGAS
ncbi:hypothetical protein [Streptomyces noursei]|uniref:hypothetical protein n=1 Tax=Streptomyces noursei TaxID=1971 RepID=UPI00381B9D36